MTLAVATFYKFVKLPDVVEKQRSLLACCEALQLRGTILLAKEGINGTVAGSPEAIAALLTELRSDPRLAGLEAKLSTADEFPFGRMKVRLKKEIVTLGVPDADPCDRVGIYVPPKDWNALITDPEVTLIDTRNDYEVQIGTFQGAMNPGTDSFRQFPDYVRDRLDPTKHRKIAMFCTGGIRCEKATAYLLNQGFQEVYHLQGGILKYLEEIPASASLWQGECFVFDERIALQQGLAAGQHDLCRSCGRPISDADKASPKYEEGISCPFCYDDLSEEKKARQIEKQRQLELAKRRQQSA